MKKIILFAIIITAIINPDAEAQKKQLNGQITLSGAFALYPLAVKWAEEFKKIHPGVNIDISGGGAGKGMTDALSGVADLGMISREIRPEEIKKGAWFVSVAKDAVIPTINIKNPKLKEILTKGLTQKTAIQIFITQEIKTWNQFLGIQGKIPIRVFNRSDACGAGETWAKYLGDKKQEDIKGTAVFGDPGIASAIQKDAVAIGYNNIAYAYDLKTRRPNPGIVVLPIDINNNGKVDADEKFYATSSELVNAIAKGKYPSPPARELYLVSKGKPTNPAVIEFLKFILSEGQKYNVPNGFVSLPKEITSKSINKLK